VTHKLSEPKIKTADSTHAAASAAPAASFSRANRKLSTWSYNALSAEVAAGSLPAVQAGRLVAFAVRIEPAEE
jgi:hypothetical protein